MPYTKTQWKDRVVEKPRTFTLQNNPDGTVTLIPVEGTIYEPGTPVNAANMNNLEKQYDAAKADLDAHVAAADPHPQYMREQGMLSESTDWNEIASGIYRVGQIVFSSTYNQPVGSYPYGTLVVQVSGNSVTQEYWTHDNGQNTGVWTRTKWNENDWTVWKKIWTDDNDGAGSGLDADTVDGKHASELGLGVIFDGTINMSTSGLVEIPVNSSISKASLSIARSSHGSACYGNNIYIIGGERATGSGYNYSDVNNIHMYNPDTNTWTSKTGLSNISSVTTYVSACELNGLIYFHIGKDSTTGSAGIMCVYNPNTNVATKLASQTIVTRELAGMFAHNEKIYLVSALSYSTIIYFDPSNNTFTTAGTLPSPVNYISCAYADGKVYITGGDQSTTPSARTRVDCWDIDTDTWTVKASMPTPVKKHHSVYINGYIYVLGGEASPNGSYTLYSTIQRYKISTNEWTTLPYSLSTNKHIDGSACVSSEGKIHITGGVWSSSYTYHTEVEDINLEKAILYNGGVKNISLVEAPASGSLIIDKGNGQSVTLKEADKIVSCVNATVKYRFNFSGKDLSMTVIG